MENYGANPNQKPKKVEFSYYRENYGAPDDHFGVFQPQCNPYLRGTLIDLEVVKSGLLEVSKLPLLPVKISSRLDGKSLSECLTLCEAQARSPPPVSSDKMRQRFEVQIFSEEKKTVQLGHVFSPSLDDLYEDEVFLNYLQCQIISLCSVATIHSEKIKNADSIGEFELVLEQELFSNILQTVLTPPFLIHSQCQTECQTLPTAKFDLLVSRGARTIENEVTVVIETESTENLDTGMTNKTNKTMNLKDKPNISVVLEALIFSELNCNNVVRLVSGSRSFIRPFIRVRASDTLFTLPKEHKWWFQEKFQMGGCILLLLFLQAGTASYPKFDNEFLNTACSAINCGCGWSEAYEPIEEKYPKMLKQTKPTMASASSRGSKLGEITPVNPTSKAEAMSRYKKCIAESLTALPDPKKAKPHQ